MAGPFRLARLDEAPALTELHTSVARDLEQKLGPGYWAKERSLRSQREKLKRSQAYPDVTGIYVAEDNGKVAATILLSVKRAPFWQKRIWQEPDAAALCVFDLAVWPELQRRGWGGRAMGFAEEQAKKRGFEWVRLDAFADNPNSVAFYKHIGYEDRGILIVGGVPLVMFEKSVSGPTT